MTDLYDRIPNPEFEAPPAKKITAANTATQVAKIPWTDPAQGVGYLEMLIVKNDHATDAAVITIWDGDIESAGVAGTAKPNSRGSTTAPLLSPIDVAVGAEYRLDKNICPNIAFQGGIIAQSDKTDVWIQVQIVKQIG